jgi:hypothetical protein
VLDRLSKSRTMRGAQELQIVFDRSGDGRHDWCQLTTDLAVEPRKPIGIGQLTITSLIHDSTPLFKAKSSEP